MEAKSKSSPLLTSYKMGKFNLSHRVVLPPLTRNRAFNSTPQPHAVKYYSQRATNGGFIISEAAAATDISLRCPNMPGIWTEKQVEAWKPIVEAVHAKGGIIFCQIWHPARISNYTFAPDGSDLIKPISNKKVRGDYHSFDTTSRGSHTPSEEGEGKASREEATASPTDSIIEDGSVVPHEYIFFDREAAVASPTGSTIKDGSVAPHAYILFDKEEATTSPIASTNEEGSVAPHAYILFDREQATTSPIDSSNEEGSVAPHAYIMFDREEVVTTSPLGSTSEDGSDAPHAYILFDREEAVTSPIGSTNKDGSIAPHAYILFDREEVVTTSPLGSTSEDGSVAPHAYILFDREEAVTSPIGSTNKDGSIAPHAYILFDREEVVTTSPLGSTSEDGSVAPHAYILFDREEAVTSPIGSTNKDGSIAPHAYILFDREEVVTTSPLGSTSEDGSVAPHAYILFDREEAATSPIGSTNKDGSIAPHAYILFDREEVAASSLGNTSEVGSVAPHAYLLLDREDVGNLPIDRNEAHTVPLLIADRVSSTTTNDRELDLDHKGVVSDKLSLEKSQSIVNDFALAARNAIKAGFDGVEINCAHGYLIDRHLNDNVKNRMPDSDGGSIEKRCRLALDVVRAVSNEVGPDRVGIKLSPFDDFHGSGNLSPITVGTYLATELNNLGLLYLHVTEPRMIKIGDEFKTPRSLEAIREAFDGTLIASGGYDKHDGDAAVAEDYADLVSFGRLFVANPDLVKRFELNAPLNKHDRSTFYVPEPVLGYTDYPSLEIVS
ncbi:oxidoreductase [Lithospermum erythrorhizon]|uniref:Oxidoreductase n=1 Tax=Lithospermum erythrorhizon TaxID=34254 RepID=A0AAV3PYU3_LITER